MPRRRFYLGLELFSNLAAALVMLWLCASGSAQAADTLRYVAPTGNDAGGGQMKVIEGHGTRPVHFIHDGGAIGEGEHIQVRNEFAGRGYLHRSAIAEGQAMDRLQIHPGLQGNYQFGQS